MTVNKVPVITLDGPSGTGKGTICHMLGEHLHWNILDSGAIYRVLAYAVRKRNIDFAQITTIADIARALNLQFKSVKSGVPQVILDGMDISKAIRTEQCGQDASIIAPFPEIRAALLERQRAFAKPPGLVTDGRDMGTVVFPDAKLKLYLDASPEERAKRRYLQLKDSKINVSLAQVVEELAKRDHRDTARSLAPLKPAADAISIDTTGLNIVQVFDNVLKLVQDHLVQG